MHQNAISVIDGDTFVATIQLWPDLSIRTRIRIDGIDAPELRGKCEAERQAAKEARLALGFLLEDRKAVLHGIRRDKYGGRFLARVALADGSDLAETLIAAGYARAYTGKTRKGWC